MLATLTESAERVLPDLDAERSNLGAIMVDNDSWPIASSIVGGEHFFRLAHTHIFRAMTRLAAQSMAIDIVTVKNALGEDLEECVGRGDLDATARHSRLPA